LPNWSARKPARFRRLAFISSSRAARAVSEFRDERRAEKKLEQRRIKEAEAHGGNFNLADVSGAMAINAPAAKPGPNRQPPLPQRILQDEAAARTDAAVAAEIGFVERLVWFWSNHFCISADKIADMAGAYEREAIRPHVLGRFGDMLQAVESHPAMLFYLDNVQSMGANSIAGINRDRGLNENLARETLELHTIGVRGGYSQRDVTSFANVLTGWTWIDPNEPEHGGEFLFNKRLHEPGEQLVLGKTYPDGGVEQGRAVLADLARRPATAQHLAQKLARHFVADEPPPSLPAKLAKTFEATDGNLKEVAKALVTADESWTPQRTKLKSPSEWLVGVLRLADPAPQGVSVIEAHLAPARWPPIGRVLNFEAVLGEALWRPPAPNGYADTEAAWLDGVPRRLDVANEFAGRLPPESDPLDLLDRSLGPLASAATRQTVARAESRAQAFALLVMAPEFLRR
jgi:uncharacterized protein (DUF1800 family)